jgi:hypothetical protein
VLLVEKSKTTTPDVFIESLPAGVRESIAEIDGVISTAMPDASRTLWEGRFWGGTDQRIIGYGDYSYRGSDGRVGEWFVIGLASQKNHLSLYVNAADANGNLLARYAERLGKVKVGSAVLSFRSAADLDLGVVRELVELAQRLSAPTD